MAASDTIRERPKGHGPGLEVEHLGGATVARLTPRELLDEIEVNAIAQRLFALVDGGCHRLVLSCAQVRRVDSTMVSKVIALHKRLQAAAGRLVLCCIEPCVYTVFLTLKLNRLFSICGTEQEALQCFA
jgi:anti-anti-sigma factor